MPYALDFPANDIGSHENVCLFVEYAFSDYMTYMRVDCICIPEKAGGGAIKFAINNPR